MNATATFRKQILAEGFAVVHNLLDAVRVATLIDSLETLDQTESVRSRGGVFAVRNLLDVSAQVNDLANSKAVRDLVNTLLGPDHFAVRGILFDKTSGANWKVPWHQDVTIAVANRVDVTGFGPWSTKAGVLHVQPPTTVLENMLTVRIHLDPCGEENGALRVVAGTHRLGKIPEVEASRIGKDGPVTTCGVGAGGALLMRPLLLHASSASVSPGHRRVIHLDFASEPLSGGLKWAAQKSFDEADRAITAPAAPDSADQAPASAVF